MSATEDVKQSDQMSLGILKTEEKVHFPHFGLCNCFEMYPRQGNDCLYRKVYYLQFPREGGMLHHTGPHREVTGSDRRPNTGQSLYCGFHRKEWERQGRQVEQVEDWILE